MKLFRSFIISLAVLLSFALSGCRSQKAATKLVASDESTTDLFYSLTKSYDSWSDLYLPVTVTLDQPKNMSISGRCTMVRDKEIYFSFRMLGFEVAQIYINSDRIYLVEKYHKYYYTESLSKLLAGYNITVGDLQDLLLGKAFMPGSGTLKPSMVSDFLLAKQGGVMLMRPKDPQMGFNWHYEVSRTVPPLVTAIILPLASGASVDCCYTDYVDSPSGKCSSVLTISAPLKVSDIKASISWNTADAKWNSGRKVDFKAPGSGYKEINVPAMLENIDKF